MNMQTTTDPAPFPRRAVVEACRAATRAGVTTDELVARVSRAVPGVSIEEIITGCRTAGAEDRAHAEELQRVAEMRERGELPPGPGAA